MYTAAVHVRARNNPGRPRGRPGVGEEGQHVVSESYCNTML